MTVPLSTQEKRIRKAAILVLIAMLGTGASLMANHPLAFIEFAVVGLTLTLVGIIYYLLSLIREPRKNSGKPVISAH